MSEEKENQKKKCKCKCKGLLLKVLLALAILLVVLVVALFLFLDFVIKTGIQTVGSTVTKCNVTVEDVSISILRGEVQLSNLVVGNPEGFKTDSAFKVGRIYVSMEPASVVMGKRTHVKEVIVEKPEITYELNALAFTSNIGAIQKNVQSMLPAKDEKEEEKPKEKKEGRPVEISLVSVTDGKIRVSATFAGGKAVPVPLPTLTLKDIGKEKEVTSSEATATVFDEICSSVSRAAESVTKSVGDAAKKVGSSAKEAGKKIIDVFKPRNQE